MTRLVLLTGFLGAGKTTLLKKLLGEYQKNRIGIIVNEFGKVGIDGHLLKKDGLELLEISNGSVFCACLKESFVDGLITLVSKDLEYIFIEASGLADPSTMESLTEGIRHKLTQDVEYQGALCVLDGESFIELMDLLPALVSQLEYSRIVLLNKTDLIDHERRQALRKIILERNPEAEILETVYCNIDCKAAVDRLSIVNKEERESTNTYESRPRTLTLKCSGKIPESQMRGFLEKLAPSTYRIKGFFQMEQGMREISCVGKHVEIKPWEGQDEPMEIAVISAVGPAIITRALEAMEQNGAELKERIRIMT